MPLWSRKPKEPDWPQFDEAEGAWIRQNRRPFHDFKVGSLVPPVFERYARLFNPAWAQSRRPWEDPPVPIRWEMVARWSGKRMHGLAQWVPLSTQLDGRPAGACPFDTPPHDGGLPPVQLGLLCGHLAAATTTPDQCLFARWEGHGGILPESWEGAPLLKLDQRNYLVLEAPLARIAELVPVTTAGFGLVEPPALIWPRDHAWFVATDPDLDYTYVGGSSGVIDAILSDDRLEAWPANPTDDISAASDEINL